MSHNTVKYIRHIDTTNSKARNTWTRFRRYWPISFGRKDLLMYLIDEGNQGEVTVNDTI